MNTLFHIISLILIIQVTQGYILLDTEYIPKGSIQIDTNDINIKENINDKVPEATDDMFVRYESDNNGPYEACYNRMNVCCHYNDTITFYNETFTLITYYNTLDDCEKRRSSGVIAKYIQLINWVGTLEEIPLKDLTKYQSSLHSDCSTIETLSTYKMNECAISNNELAYRFKRVQNGIVLDAFNGMECDQWIGSEYFFPIEECHDMGKYSYKIKYVRNSSIGIQLLSFVFLFFILL